MYSASKFDGIAFSPSKNIKVAGVGFFGPIKEGYSFLGIVRLVEGQSIEGRIAAVAVVTAGFATENAEMVSKVMFAKPILVRQNEIWSIIADLHMMYFLLCQRRKPYSSG
mgnify:CR=1 FL=1